MASLLRNEFSKVVKSFTVVDCRFPYEFAGGHIQGAKNIYTREALMAELFSSPPEVDRSFNLSKKRDILIFHCEFSSERAPNLSRFLRRKDRDFNVNDYPHLYYPEVYLLDGGYKSFYEQFADLCSPTGYIPMLHANHKDDLKYYRSKSLSWSNDKTRLPSKIK